MKRPISISLLSVTLFLIPLLIISCRNNEEAVVAAFPESPTNLAEFNTEYDDYNSTAPSYGETFPFCFSSNRNSAGNNYDIVYKLMTIEFSKDTKELEIFNNLNGNLSVVIENNNINNALTQINTSADEYGPSLIPQGKVEGGSNINNRYEAYVLMYSTEYEGNQDIKFTHNLEGENYVTPINLDFVNSEFDDAYPTFNKDYSQLLFSSNRAGPYNIYSNLTDNSLDILDVLNNTISQSKNENTLSSENDDKCPFIIDDFLVFTSNRMGGYGGYDLYYSIWENDQWSMPINFGENINSEFDEYRPIVRREWEFENDLMIFSSNRPEGKGGFDLYYVGIDQLRQ